MRNDSKIKLDHAELFFKFVLGISDYILTSDKPLEYLGIFSFGKHTANYDDLKLNREQEKRGSAILEHVGTYMMILQLNKVLEDEWGEQRLQSNDNDIRIISQVVRLIRNAFAHDPFNPIWDISKSTENQTFDIPKILTLKTNQLDGKKVNRMDYGGPLALLRLLQYTKKKLENST